MISRHLPYASCFAVAVALRCGALGQAPLTTSEAAAAWTAWTAASAGAPAMPWLETPPLSAALFGLQTAVFWFADGGDVAARLPVALIGAAVVVLPWIFWRALGRLESIVLAMLLTFDPVFVGFSRRADGAAITAVAVWTSVFCALALAATSPGQVERRATLLTVAAGAAGVIIISGPLAWDVLPVLIATVIYMAGRGAATLLTSRVLLPMAVVAALVGTSFLSQSHGLQTVSASMTAWRRQWSESGDFSFSELWTLIGGLEAVPLLLGIIGLALAQYSRYDDKTALRPLSAHHVAVAAGWLLWAFILTLRPGRLPSIWLVMQPALFVAAAYAARRVADAGTVGRLMHARPLAGSILAAIALVSFVQFAGGAMKIASGARSSSFRVDVDVTEPAVRHLRRDVHALLLDAPITSQAAMLQVVTPRGADPVIGWQLRLAPGLRWVHAPSPPSPSQLQLTFVDDTSSPATDGSVYPLRRRAGVLQRVRLQ